MRAQASKPEQVRRSSTPRNEGRAAPAVPRTPAALVRSLQRRRGNRAVARMANDRRDALVQRSAVDRVLSSPGTPLGENRRTAMESRFGTEFDDVRIHSDAPAQQSAKELGAQAYTSGSHIVLGSGSVDDHVLAHELTHVIQQRAGRVAGVDHGDGLRVSDPGDAFEREAEAVATNVMRLPTDRNIGPGGTPLRPGESLQLLGDPEADAELPEEKTTSGNTKTYFTESPTAEWGWLEVNTEAERDAELKAVEKLRKISGARVPQTKLDPIPNRRKPHLKGGRCGWWVENLNIKYPSLPEPKNITVKPVMGAQGAAGNFVKICNSLKAGEGGAERLKTLLNDLTTLKGNLDAILDIVGEFQLGISRDTGNAYILDAAPGMDRGKEKLASDDPKAVESIKAGMDNWIIYVETQLEEITMVEEATDSDGTTRL